MFSLFYNASTLESCKNRY